MGVEAAKTMRNPFGLYGCMNSWTTEYWPGPSFLWGIGRGIAV